MGKQLVWRLCTGFAGSLMVAALVAFPATAATRSSRDWSVGYQLNPAHTGVAVADSLRPPLVPVWGVRFETPTGEVGQSYPIIVQGRVFVTADGGGTALVGLNLYTGKPLFTPRVVGLGGTGGAAYTSDTLVTGDGAGFLAGLDPRSGKIRWRALMPLSEDIATAPSAASGRVVQTNGSYAAAFSARTGRPLWARRMIGSTQGIPALSMRSAFVANGVGETWRLSAATGETLWQHMPGWSADDGRPVTVAGGRAYVRTVTMPNRSLVLDTATGRQTGTFQATTPLAVDGGRVFSANCMVDIDCPNDFGYQLQAHDADGRLAWSYDGTGGGTLAPVVANGIVWVAQTGGSSQLAGSLVGLDEATGRVVWRAPLPEPNAGGSFGYDTQMPGIAIGGGWLVLNDGGMVVAFAPAAAEPTVTIDRVRWQPRRLGTSSAPVTIRLRDTGMTPLTVSGLALAGAGRRNFRITADGCTGAVLRPLTTCAVAVEFRPRTRGTSFAELSFATSTGTENQATVSLGGYGGVSRTRHGALAAESLTAPVPTAAESAGSSPTRAELTLRRVVYRRP